MPGGGWAGSDRAARLPKEWHRIRARTWRAAHGRCQAITDDGARCTWHGRLNGDGGQADHIQPGNGDHQTNMQWLCPTHHAHKSSLEGNTARATRQAKALHPREQHPGLT